MNVWRDLAGPVGLFATGARNAITDVSGVRVGHAQAGSGEATGVSVIVPPRLPARAGVSTTNGVGELTKKLEIDEWGIIQSPVWLWAIRTAPIGPSNGMPEIISDADAALMLSTSCGFSMSAPITVSTTCTSLRNPSGKAGRNGRSVSRQVRTASSVGRPSRRKNEPGILPAA